jgi:hydroxymethylbilane synthase
MKRTIRIGSRDSLLALIQTEIVIDAIRACDPEIEVELVKMKTTGDKILDRTLDQVGGKGLFVKELDEALLSHQVDLTVHSFKDMPMEQNPALPIVALSAREDPRDALVLPESGVMGAGPIGSSSLRRQIQLRALFPEHETRSVRGNVQTRLRKLEEENYSALVLASAGLRRLGLENRIARYFTPDEMIPAACQGILAVQGRAGEDYRYLAAFDCPESHLLAAAERGFVRALNGGCSAPTAAYAELHNGVITLRTFYVSETGFVFRAVETAPADQAEQLGIRMAEKALAAAKKEDTHG